jgi:hypothetical protein
MKHKRGCPFYIIPLILFFIFFKKNWLFIIIGPYMFFQKRVPNGRVGHAIYPLSILFY